MTDAARVGVPAFSVPPPPAIGRLPNLTPHERAVEHAFIEHYEADPDGVAGGFRDTILKSTKPGDPPTFGTDDAKTISEAWSHPDAETRLENRATLNNALHQTANAICKRAFLQQLDALDKGDQVLVTVGGCGCHVANTPIMMSDGSLQMVQDIDVGDELMGPDSKPRKVLRQIKGHGKLYDVVPTKGKTFRVNEDHVLSIRTNRILGSKKRSVKLTVNMTVREILQRGSSFLTSCQLYRVGVEFPYQEVTLDPYYLGMWLGNGTHTLPSITTMDEEVVDYLREFTSGFPSTELVTNAKEEGNKARDYRIALLNKSVGKGTPNPVTQMLRDLGVLGNKHIPDLYLRNDRDVRLYILAGLLDSDGSYGHGVFEFMSKHVYIANDVAWLARSLGMTATVRSRLIKTQFIPEARTYWRVHISGNIDIIPTKVKRKQADPRLINKDPLVTGFTLVPVGEGDYHGFTLEGDGLYLLDDFTVTHNSGKGYGLKKVPDALALKSESKVVWDSAGDQCATENPWIQHEAEKRGLKVAYFYCHADPKVQWADPKMGVVKRAEDPGDGRMVDSKVFADSYAVGARNHQAFFERNRDNPNAKFVFVSNKPGSDPQRIPGIPHEALHVDAKELSEFAAHTVRAGDAPARIKDGATQGERVWQHH